MTTEPSREEAAFALKMRRVRQMLRDRHPIAEYYAEMARLMPIIQEVVTEANCSVVVATCKCCCVVAEHPTKNVDAQAWYMCAGAELLLEESKSAVQSQP